ncbi:MAG: hypothetical protein HZB55_09770 [Deltaproteobacteria bacterium]|nr:hypothetical protein [Deltaproteobacteria bacterium]
MKRPDGTARAWRSWPRSWAASAALALALVACGRENAPSAGPRPAEAVQAVLDSWMGQYSRRDETLRVLLSAQEGWGKLRAMALVDAAGLFSGSAGEADRLGAARSYLALAETFSGLDELQLAAEERYFGALGSRASAGERARGESARRRQGAGSPGPAELVRQVRALVSKGVDPSGCARAADALSSGDPAAALAVLRRLDGAHPSGTVGPDLFAYLLRRRAYAGLALRALGEPRTPDAAFVSGLAREHLGDDQGAAAQYAVAEKGAGPGASAAWLFSPCLGAGEAARLAAVRRGAILVRQGRRTEALSQWDRALAGRPGPLVTATLAMVQVRARSDRPLADPLAAATAAVAEAAALPEQFPVAGADDLLASLYPVRVAAVHRVAAEAFRRAGQERRALDLMERAHRKTSGFRPDFVNDPAFLVDLCRAYVDAGDYAPAVAVLFELSREYPSVRLAYESLKRLYAARSGGETQPRY